MEKEEGEEDKSSDQVKSEEEEEGKENNNSSSNSNSGNSNSNSRKRKADCVDRDTNTVVTGRRRENNNIHSTFGLVWTQSSEFRGLSDHPINVPRFLAGIQGWEGGGRRALLGFGGGFSLLLCNDQKTF